MDSQYFEDLHGHRDSELTPMTEYVDYKENFQNDGENNNLRIPDQHHKDHNYSSVSNQQSEQTANFQNMNSDSEVPAKIQKRREAQRQKYHQMTPEQKKNFSRRRSESFKRCLAKNNQILSTPLSQATPEMLAKAQNVVDKKIEKAEKERIRYHQATDEERKARNEKKRIARNAKRQERMKIVESQDSDKNRNEDLSNPMIDFGEMDNDGIDQP